MITTPVEQPENRLDLMIGEVTMTTTHDWRSHHTCGRASSNILLSTKTSHITESIALVNLEINLK
jgi:hypothetical protein